MEQISANKCFDGRQLRYSHASRVRRKLAGAGAGEHSIRAHRLKGYQVFAWFGLAAPAGLPAPGR